MTKESKYAAVKKCLSVINNFFQQILNSSSAQIQILLAACQMFAMVKTSDNGTGWKSELTPFLDHLTAQKIKFSSKNLFSKCDQIPSFLQIWSHLLRNSFMENFIFSAMSSSHKTIHYQNASIEIKLP